LLHVDRDDRGDTRPFLGAVDKGVRYFRGDDINDSSTPRS
jgi:hypothetical protein